MSSRNSRLLGQPAPVEPVVGRHDGECAALADGDLEGHQIELAQRALVDDRADGRPLELGVVADEVLDGGEDALRLDAAHVAGGEATRQQRVLGVALEVAAGQRRPVQVHRRGEQSAATAVARLAPDEGAERLRQRRVPGCAEAEPHGMQVEGAPPIPGSEFPRAPFGPSVTCTLGMPEPLDGNRGQHVLSRSESGLLLKRQRANQRFDIRQFTSPVLAL